jgi:predicted secreted protein
MGGFGVRSIYNLEGGLFVDDPKRDLPVMTFYINQETASIHIINPLSFMSYGAFFTIWVTRNGAFI